MSYIARVALAVSTCPSFGGCYRPDYAKRSSDSGADSQTSQFCGLALFSKLGIDSTLGDARSMLLDRCRENYPADQCHSSIEELWQDRDLASTVFPATASEFCQTLRLAVAASEKSSSLAEKGMEEFFPLDFSMWEKPPAIGLDKPGSWQCEGGKKYKEWFTLMEEADAQCGWSECQTKCLETDGCSKFTVKLQGDKVYCAWPNMLNVHESSTSAEPESVSSACEFVADSKAPKFQCMSSADAGGPLVSGPDSLQDCRDACRDDPDCRFATFDADPAEWGGGCYLASSEASISRLERGNGNTGMGPDVKTCQKIVQPSKTKPTKIALGLQAAGQWKCSEGKEYYFASTKLVEPFNAAADSWEVCDGKCKSDAIAECQRKCEETPGCTKFHMENDAHGGLYCFAASCKSQIGTPSPDAVHLYTACEFVKS